MRVKKTSQIGWPVLKSEDLELLEIVCDALCGEPDFREWIVRAIAAGFTSRQTQRFVSSPSILKSKRAMYNMKERLHYHGKRWERDDLYQELACLLIPIVKRAKDGEKRDYFVRYSFRYAVIDFLRKLERETKPQKLELSLLSETAFAADWVRGECLPNFRTLSPLERQLVMHVTEKVHTVASAARMFGYTRQWTSHLYHAGLEKVGASYIQRG